MHATDALIRYAGAIALVGAVVPVAIALVVGEGDPEAMALGVIAAIILISPFALMAPRLPRCGAYRSAMAVALATAFILFWMIGGVGLMGSGDHHPNDVMYIVVPIVGMLGAIISRFQPRGMAWALLATALAQLLVPLVVVIAGLNLVPISLSQLVAFTLTVNAPFAALYLGSAWLFRKAAREQLTAAVQPQH